MPAPTPPSVPNPRPTTFAAPITKVYERAVDELLINIARHFDAMDPEAGSADWQFRMLAKLGQLRQENLAIVAKNVGGNQTLVLEALKKSAFAAIKEVESSLKTAVKKGFLNAANFPPEASPRIIALLQAYQHQALTTLNMVNTVMLDSSVQAYMAGITQVKFTVDRALAAQEILDTETGVAMLSAKTRASAVRSAVNKLNNMGLTGFVDHGGHHWSPESYVDMDMRTTMHNTYRQAVWDRNADYNNDLVYAPAKGVSRPGCYPWQNVILSTTGNARAVTDFDGRQINVVSIYETSYGQPAGLWGINCGHGCNIFIPGLSKIRGEVPDEEQNDRLYSLSQDQKRLERDVRLAKRKALMAEASNDKEAFEHAALQVKDKQAKLNEFISRNGKISNPNTYVYGYNKNVAGKVRGVSAKNTGPAPITRPTPRFSFTPEKPTGKYKAALEKALASGAKEYQDLYKKYVPAGGACRSLHSSKSAFYPDFNGILLDGAADLENPCGIGTIFFHEHGHYIDYNFNYGHLLSDNTGFANAIKQDYETLLKSFKDQDSSLVQARKKLSDDLRKDDPDGKGAVSDIASGASNDLCRGKYHHPSWYWARNPENMTAEAFANMFASQFNGTEKYLIQYFPNAYNEFKKLVKKALV